MNMNDKQLQMTQKGLESLKKELEDLESRKRPNLVERLSRAREAGDLAENNDYTSAKEELEFLDGRIAELKQVLDNTVVVNGVKNGSGVAVGTLVTLKVDGSQQEFSIVGDWEADPDNKKISHTSPLGKALVGKKIGEKVEVDAPAGKITYEILSIE